MGLLDFEDLIKTRLNRKYALVQIDSLYLEVSKIHEIVLRNWKNPKTSFISILQYPSFLSLLHYLSFLPNLKFYSFANFEYLSNIITLPKANKTYSNCFEDKAFCNIQTIV